MRDPEDQKYWSVSFPPPARAGFLRAMRSAAEYIQGIDPRAFQEGFAKLAAFERERWEQAGADHLPAEGRLTPLDESAR